jgi:hypothetical protein
MSIGVQKILEGQKKQALTVVVEIDRGDQLAKNIDLIRDCFQR